MLKLVRKRVQKLRDGEANGFGNDFLGVLLNAYHDPEEDKRISLEDVVDECKAFYNVGQKTTNSLLPWTVILLAIHPDWQDKARKEVVQIFGQQKPFSDGIAKFKIVRKYIPLFIKFRYAQILTDLGNMFNSLIHDADGHGYQ